MSTTITIQSSGVGYTSTPSSSSWNTSKAMQGQYNGSVRVGMIQFPAALRNVVWKDQQVNSIIVEVYCDGSGASYANKKQLCLYPATKNSFTGTGASCLNGGYFGAFAISGTGFNARGYATLSSASNPVVFENFVNWLQNGTTYGLVLYNTAGQSGSNYNYAYYLGITYMKLTIDYEPKGSSFTEDDGKTAVTPSDSGLSFTINPIETEATVLQHVMRVLIGETAIASLQKTAATGVTAIAYTAANLRTIFLQIKAAGLAASDVRFCLDTYEGGTTSAYLRGTREVAITFTVPEAARPSAKTFAAIRYGSYIDDEGHTVYREDISGSAIWINLGVAVDSSAAPNCQQGTIALYGIEPGSDERTALTLKDASGAVVSSVSNLSGYGFEHGTIATPVSPTDEYQLEIVISNGYFTTVASVMINKATAPLHIAGTGYGVGVGRFSDGDADDPKFQVAWPAYFEGGIPGVTNYSTDEVLTGGTWIDGRALYRRTFVIPVTASNANIDYAIPDDIDLILDFSGVLVASGSSSQRPINWYYPSMQCGVYRYGTSAAISVRATELGTAYVTCLYVKTGE